MAIYTTFFLASPEELAGGFPGWKLALPAPVRREILNPFTKQLISIETREPEWSADEERGAMPRYGVAAIQGRYEDHLENRLPPFARQQPHWAAKGLTEIEIEPLLRALGVNTELESPIYAPPSSGAVLLEFPADFIPELSGSDRSDLARQWAAAMSTPEHTHSVSGTKLSDGWTTEQASQILNSLVALAGKATAGQRMYLLIEA